MKFLKNYFVHIIIIGLGIALIVSLNNAYQEDRNEFWQSATVVIASITAIFAGIAALIARNTSRETSKGLVLTEDSLALTKSAQRPFLTITHAKDATALNSSGITVPSMKLTITNTGSLPADATEVKTTLFKAPVNKEKLSELYSEDKYLGVLFPSQQYEIMYLIKPEHVGDFNNGRTEIHILTTYKANRKNCHTTNVLAIGTRVSRAQRLFTPKPDKQSWS